MFDLVITGFPRSGTTNIWRLCKEITGIPIYYEPFNEELLSCNTEKPNKLHHLKIFQDFTGRQKELIKRFVKFDFKKSQLSIKEKEYLEFVCREEPCGIKENRFIGFLPSVYRMNPRARMIYCVRDPRGVWASMNFYSKGLTDGSIRNFYGATYWSVYKPILKDVKKEFHKFCELYEHIKFVDMIELKLWNHPRSKGYYIADYDKMCSNPKQFIYELSVYLGENLSEERVEELASTIDTSLSSKWKMCYSKGQFDEEYKRYKNE
jgi:hypothetical protein